MRKRWLLLVPLAAALAACGGEPTALLNSGPSFNQQGPTEISASSSAAGQLIKTFPWAIEKTADRDLLQLFEGDAAAARFTVALTRDDSVNVSGVADTICVDNTGEFPTEALVVTDKVQFHTGDEIWQDLAGATASLGPAEQIPAGGSQCYGLQVLFDPQAGAVYRTFAQVTIGNFGGDPDSFPGVDSLVAAFELPDTLTGEANRTVNVEDSAGESWLFEDSGSQTYDVTFACGADVGDNDNVVTILETGQTAEARVTVECYALNVTKTVETEFTRTYGWELEKTSDTTDLILPRGFPWDVDYAVSVDTAGYTDSDAGVSGTITIANPAPMVAQLLGVADLVSPDIELQVDCGVEFPMSLDEESALECAYAGDLPDLEERTNTASATIQNYAYDVDGAASESGTTEFSGSEAVTFGDPSNELDTCVAISDDWAGELGTACLADDELPKTFTYTSTLGAYDECGMFGETNTASFETGDNAATGSATWTVDVNVPCGPDCTLSQGYWKNHSLAGPAPYDNTWAYMPEGAETSFFDTEKTWLYFFREPPTGGNAYIKVARQYMAAWLSGLHGANVAEVADEIQQAMEWLDQYDGDPEPFDLDDKKLQHDFNKLQERLDRFNNGMVGPPKCDDDDGGNDKAAGLTF
jgi:hypothetical protein